MSIPALIALLKANPTLEGFQGVIINQDCSILITCRHGSRYYPTVADALKAITPTPAPATPTEAL